MSHNDFANRSFSGVGRTQEFRTTAPKPAHQRTAFRDLQSYWYGKLKESGFCDVEYGRDANRLSTSTLPSDRFIFIDSRDRAWHGGQASADLRGPVEQSLVLNARHFGKETSAADLPVAQAWRDLSKAAHDLPADFRGRLFVIDLCQVGCIAAYLLKRHKLTRQNARTIWHRFLAVAEMPEATRLLVCGDVRTPDGEK